MYIKIKSFISAYTYAKARRIEQWNTPPPTFTTRVLDLSDYDLLTSLYREHTTHMGVARDDYGAVLTDDKLVNEYLNPEFKNKLMFGTFLDNQLVLSMGIYFWPTLPSCTFLRFAGRKGAFPGRTIREPFKSLYGACLKAIEERDYNRIYLLTIAQHQETFAYIDPTWKEFQTKYVLAIEETIPAYERSKFEFFWNIMGRRTWPKPIVVRSVTLKNQFRKFDRKIVSERTLKAWGEEVG